jgi:hypothetical protein
VTDYLADIASDLSVFHRVKDAGEMDSAAFFLLAFRLPAYQGAMAAAVARQQQDGARPAGRGARTYERSSGMANNGRAAEQAPPATAAALAGVNAQLGGGWISHRTVKAVPEGGDS